MVRVRVHAVGGGKLSMAAQSIGGGRDCAGEETEGRSIRTADRAGDPRAAGMRGTFLSAVSYRGTVPVSRPGGSRRVDRPDGAHDAEHDDSVAAGRSDVRHA